METKFWFYYPFPTFLLTFQMRIQLWDCRWSAIIWNTGILYRLHCKLCVLTGKGGKWADLLVFLFQDNHLFCMLAVQWIPAPPVTAHRCCCKAFQTYIKLSNSFVYLMAQTDTSDYDERPPETVVLSEMFCIPPFTPLRSVPNCGVPGCVCKNERCIYCPWRHHEWINSAPCGSCVPADIPHGTVCLVKLKHVFTC